MLSSPSVEPVAPFFAFDRGQWIPHVLAWDPETGALRSVEGPRGFDTYRAAVAASRFLMVGEPLSCSREESAC